MKPSNTIIVSSDQIVRLNGIIHNQREKLRTLEEDKKIIKAEKKNFAEQCKTQNIGVSKTLKQ